MASCPAQPRAHPGPLLLLQEWGWARSDSTSPTSSPDAHRLSPSSASPASREPRPRRVPSLPPKQRGGRRAAGSGQRQSASEREKLRMRNLAKALHTLRCYLPPSVAPAGQSLTKIETLRLAIRYIAHLSERLGLSEQALAQRREPPRRCQLCPEGLGCCQARTPGRRATEPWVSPSYCPAAGTPLWPHGAPGTDTAAWLSAPPCPDAATPCRLVWTPRSRAASWVSATSCSDAGTPPELHGARLSDVLAWGSPTARPTAGSPPEPRGRQITDTAPWGSPLSCPDAPAAPEDSGTGALDARRRTWPTHGPLLAAFHQARPASPVLDWSVNPGPQPIGSLPEGPAAEPGWQREWWAAGTDHGMSSRTSAAVGHGDPGLFVEQI